VIAVLLSMLRARWAQAVTVFLLSVVATAAAVAGPVALSAVDHAVVRNEVADATTAERSLMLNGAVDPSDPGGSSAFQSFTNLVTIYGFHTVEAGELRAFGPVPTGNPSLTVSGTSRVAFRDELCQHLVIVSGRCLAGPLDIVVGSDTAKRRKLQAGQQIDLQAEKATPTGQLVPDGAVGTFTIAGIYTPRDPSEPYWGSQAYFPMLADGTRDETLFVSPETFDLIDHKLGLMTADSLAPPSAFAPDRLDALADDVAQAESNAQLNSNGFTLDTGIPALLARIRQGEDVAGQLVPVAFLPLVALSWFVIFLAVGDGVAARRHELGLVNLRGVRVVRRWWLALGETVVMIVLGAPIGYLLGYAVVSLVARARLGDSAGTTLNGAELPYAALALFGALAVALLSQRRALREPVSRLLRGVVRSRGAWQSTVVEAALVVLAVLGVVELRGAGGGLFGVSLLVPGLVVVGVSLVIARVFVPIAGVAARWALRRGRLGLGLAAVQIARRPGSQRLFTLLSVAVGLLAFVAASLSVAGQARNERAGVTVGAAGVLTVARVSPAQLIDATHKVDPAGTWAMAVVQLEQSDGGAPPVLAVDSGRLARVADWQAGFGASAAALAAKLRPSSPQSLVLRSPGYTVDIERGQPFSLVDTNGDGIPDAPAPPSPIPIPLTFTFESLVDGSPVVSTLDVSSGRHTYTASTPDCVKGCRLTGFNASAGAGTGLTITIYGMTSDGGDVIPASALAKRARWRGIGTTRLVVGDSLEASVSETNFESGDLTVYTVDSPVPVPVYATDGLFVPGGITGVDGQSVAVRSAGTVAMLPRLGTTGILVDLDYLQHVSLSTVAQDDGEVWLGPTAPADAVQRLRKAGLSIMDETSVADTRAALDRSGPALALRFHAVAAVLSIGLAIGGFWLAAAVDRRRRAEDLAALRRQGLRRRTVGRAASWGYLWLVSGAAVTGLLAAAVAWAATGDRLPVLTDTSAALPPPRWPQPSSVGVSWAWAAAAMLVVAIAVGLVLRRTVKSAMKGRGAA
jgi:hypothetical protein